MNNSLRLASLGGRLLSQKCRKGHLPSVASSLKWGLNRKYSSKNYVDSSEKVDYVRIYDSDGRSLGNKRRRDAEELARKRGLVLVPMPIIGMSRPKYPEYQLKPLHASLETSTHPDTDDDPEPSGKSVDKKKEQLGLKRIVFAHNIADNDLKSKIDSANRLVSKGWRVHITVSGAGAKKLHFEEMFDKIKTRLDPMLRTVRVTVADSKLSFGVIRSNKDQVPIISKDATQDDDLGESIDPDLIDDDEKLKEIFRKTPKT